jgi:hypothetical protein
MIRSDLDPAGHAPVVTLSAESMRRTAWQFLIFAELERDMVAEGRPRRAVAAAGPTSDRDAGRIEPRRLPS